MSSKGEARTFITKEAAAQRQLDAAIRMTLAGEDELAIHSVAAAAYGIIRALKEVKRDRSEIRDLLGLGIFLFARDLASGKVDKLPDDFIEPLVGIITDVSAAIRRGEITNEEDVIRKLAIRDENSHWTRFNVPANFLKHANRDPDSALPDEQVNNDLLLMAATRAYVELMGPGSSTPEMLVYYTFSGGHEGLTPKMQAIAQLPLSRRRRLCLSLLRDLKERGTIALM